MGEREGEGEEEGEEERGGRRIRREKGGGKGRKENERVRERGKEGGGGRRMREGEDGGCQREREEGEKGRRLRRKDERGEDGGGGRGEVGSGKRRSNINYKQIKNRSGRVLESELDDDICRITGLTSSNVRISLGKYNVVCHGLQFGLDILEYIPVESPHSYLCVLPGSYLLPVCVNLLVHLLILLAPLPQCSLLSLQ